MAEQVEDRSAERGIVINNILTGLILAAIVWVGSTIEQLKEMVWGLVAEQKLQQQQIVGLKEQLQVQVEVDKSHNERLRKLEDK